MQTWKVIPSNPVKKDSFEDKPSKSRVPFTVKTENRFAGIGDQFCDTFDIENTEPDVIELQKPIKNRLKKKKIKKNKKVRTIQKFNTTDSTKATPSDEKLQVIR